MTYATSRDGTRIQYVQAGNGPVLVMIGGALQTKSDRLMAPLMELLARDFTVISYDRRGRGGSEDAGLYTIDREIEDVEAILKEAGGAGSVFGNSSGGQLALYAASRLSNIGNVAVYEAPFSPEAGPGDAREYLTGLEKSLSEGRPGDALKAFFKRIGLPAPMILAMRLTPMWRGLKALAPTLAYDARMVGDGSVPAEFGSIAARLLALTGDSEAMRQGAERLVDRVPGSRHEVLAGQSHAVKPEVLADALRAFFRA